MPEKIIHPARTVVTYACGNYSVFSWFPKKKCPHCGADYTSWVDEPRWIEDWEPPKQKTDEVIEK